MNCIDEWGFIWLSVFSVNGVYVPVLSVPEQLQVSEPKGRRARLADSDRVRAGAAAVHGQNRV